MQFSVTSVNRSRRHLGSIRLLMIICGASSTIVFWQAHMKTLKAKQINRSEEQRNNFVMVYGNDFIQHILGIKTEAKCHIQFMFMLQYRTSKHKNANKPTEFPGPQRNPSRTGKLTKPNAFQDASRFKILQLNTLEIGSH